MRERDIGEGEKGKGDLERKLKRKRGEGILREIKKGEGESGS